MKSDPHAVSERPSAEFIQSVSPALVVVERPLVAGKTRENDVLVPEGRGVRELSVEVIELPDAHVGRWRAQTILVEDLP